MNKAVGSTLLISGTAIGAGMLGLPLAAGLAGFAVASIVLIIIWAVMTYTGLLILEVNLTLPLTENSFSSMAKHTAGPLAGIIASISVMLLLYSLTGAYISGAESMLSIITLNLLKLQLPLWVNSAAFTLIFGYVIWHSTRAVDTMNQLFISIKGILIIISLALLMPSIHYHHLLAQPHHWHSTLLIGPIFLTSFGFHTVIPSLTNYLGKKPKTLKKVIIIGATIPLFVYLLWLIATLGVIPQNGPHSFTSLNTTHSVAHLINNIMVLTRSRWVNIGINGFANIAMITSFLGVTLGLFDFLADVCKCSPGRIGRLQAAALTFIPPLIFSFIYPNGFFLALTFAAIFVAILEVLLPVWMVISLRKKAVSSTYQVRTGRVVLTIVFLIGLFLIASTFIG